MNLSFVASRRSVLKFISFAPAIVFLPVDGSEWVNSYKVVASDIERGAVAARLKIFLDKFSIFQGSGIDSGDVNIDVTVVDASGETVKSGCVYLVPPDVYHARGKVVAPGLKVADLDNGKVKFKACFPIAVARPSYLGSETQIVGSYFDLFVVTQGKLSGIRMQLAQGLCESMYTLKGSGLSLRSRTLSDLYFESGAIGALMPGVCISPVQHDQSISIKANVTLMS